MTESAELSGTNAPFSAAAVIGLGLIGASLAGALAAKMPGARVFGVDTDAATCAAATDRGWCDAASGPDDPAFRAFIENDCELVVIATPVAAVDDYLVRLRDWGYTGVVTDTISTKGHILAAAAELLPAPARYVPGHPMAGSEQSGIAGARTDLFEGANWILCGHILAAAAELLPAPARYVPGHPMAGSEQSGIAGARTDLFEGANWILCPDESTVPEDFQHLHELVTGLDARVVSLRREEHDAAVAVVSHVPHMVASSLMQLASAHADDTGSIMRLAAGGFKDTTRIAAGSPKLWCGIAFDNACALKSGLDEMASIAGCRRLQGHHAHRRGQSEAVVRHRLRQRLRPEERLGRDGLHPGLVRRRAGNRRPRDVHAPARRGRRCPPGAACRLGALHREASGGAHPHGESHRRRRGGLHHCQLGGLQYTIY